ncbi:hypothetical protein EYF80_008162 [Liparis tanakae]|uniref:Uncharacterized protein n=1 Tax=Liparis tanakae TaxID=230148 RepID=A0A4Z2IV24_9TELE|nr:hypothetical protein EYF80_008162 [Liparis tanakae]
MRPVGRGHKVTSRRSVRVHDAHASRQYASECTRDWRVLCERGGTGTRTGICGSEDACPRGAGLQLRDMTWTLRNS